MLNNELKTNNNFFIDEIEKNEETIDPTIYDREGVLKDLKEDGLRLKNYSDQVQNDFECVITAIKSNIKAYEFIADKYKVNSKVINLYWEEYIKLKEKESSNNKEFEDFYPEFLNTNRPLDEIISELTRRKNQ